MKIAVMGAGGVGGYVGGRLAEAGEDVTLIARGVHLAALRERGLRIESPYGDAVLADIKATDDPGAVGPVDLVLFTVKLGDTDAAAAMLGPLVGPATRVLTLQNGVDSRDMVGRHVAADCIAVGIIYLAAQITGPGVIGSPGGVSRIHAGTLHGDATLVAFGDACAGAVGLEAEMEDDATRAVWFKFVGLVAFSGVTAISRLPIGAVFETPATRDFMARLLDEAIAVAGARGLDFGADDAARIMSLYENQPYEHRASMAVDLVRGRPLELPWLSGRVAELGREFGIATPANDAVVAALAAYVDGVPHLSGGA